MTDRETGRGWVNARNFKCSIMTNSKFTAVSLIARQRERGAQSGRINDEMDTRA